MEKEDIEKLCSDMKEVALANCKNAAQRQSVKDVTKNVLLNWRVLDEDEDGAIHPTNAYVFLTGQDAFLSKIQCGMFKGTTRAVFVDKRDYEGPLWQQAEEAFQFVLRIVRFFNDPAMGASFTNFFTGTVDIEAKRDADDNLIGIAECSQEVYDSHTRKHEPFQSAPAGTGPDAATEAGTGKGNGEWLKDYEDYGVSYNSQDDRLYYGGEEIRMLVDSEKAFVYSTDEKEVCLAVSRDGNHNITEIKNLSERDAGLLLQANKPNASADYATEEN